MSKVIEFLKDFNRKERFILLDHVLGQRTEEVFRLDPYFAGRLAGLLRLEVPADAFVAMDYHLDWIQMALYLADQPNSQMSKIIPNADSKLVKANQEDVDLLVAFEGSQNTHLVLIEAKADTGWNNDQLISKARRLRLIFDENPYGANFVKPVKPHFVLMSPSKSPKIRTAEWPCWMKRKGEDPAYYWLELPLRYGLLKVTRCHENGREGEKGCSLFISRYEEDKDGRWKDLHHRT